MDVGRSQSDAQARRVMLSQLGLITLEQALACGLSRDTIRYRVRSGRWCRLFPGVYRSSEVDLTWQQKLLAAQLWLGPECAVSHRSAGLIYGFRGVPEGFFELTVDERRHPRAAGVTIHRGPQPAPSDIKTKGEFRLTSVELTLCDLATVLKPRPLTAAVDSSLSKGLTTVDRISSKLDELRGPGRSGCAVLGDLLDQRRRGIKATDSELEIDYLNLCRQFRLPLPTNQRHFKDERGEIGRIDFTYPEGNLHIELDGYEWHASIEQWRKDRERDRRLQALGWRVLRYTWWDLHDTPKAMAEEIRSFLYPQLGAASADRNGR